MSLSHLLVLHRRKSAHATAAPAATPPSISVSQPIFRLETCLRELWVVSTDSSAAAARLAQASGFERHHGSRAYEFLLRVGCGLDSEIRGESDVFGQLRDAWREFAVRHPAHAHELGPVLQRVFEDVKEIRSRHLRALGATTYGGLTRKLLAGHAKAPTLLIGAGRMAQAVLPYLAAETLCVWNRTESRIAELLATVAPSRDRKGVDRHGVRVLSSHPTSEIEAWQQASNVILCVPADPERDAGRVAAWHGRQREGRLIHLGLLSAATTPWNEVVGLATLQDLFALQAEHTALRDAHLARAAAACHEKAKLRSLGGPLSLAHGWEDLSLFASTG